MTGVDHGELAMAAKRLGELAAELYKRGFSARVLATDQRLRVWVQNRSLSQLSEVVYAASDGDGAWWIWWSWDDQIASIDDVDTAAFKIAYVLTPA